MRWGIGGRRWHLHRPHHFFGLGMILAGLIIVLLMLPPFIWVVVVGIYLCYLGWQLLGQR